MLIWRDGMKIFTPVFLISRAEQLLDLFSGESRCTWRDILTKTPAEKGDIRIIQCIYYLSYPKTARADKFANIC